MQHAGIDEAGYGPTLGPLVVATAWAEASDHASLVEGFRATLNLDFEPFIPDATTLALAQDLTTQKYGAETWNQRR